MITVQRKIGQNRGKPRLWLEGKHLVAAGLDHGTRWTLIPTDTGFTIQRDADGARRVAGKPGRPIIDINSPRSLGVLAGAATVTLTYEPGGGVIHVR
ncbi:hypothetical protein [Primorskyibacter sp. S87]|uniref:hypothetical protein n=1 Tax=Primorskyibacter sp. S87 TaxID=3415126 RepID=UPI003C7E18B7